MLERLAADTSIITYLMAAMGIMGILAKIINHFTLVRLGKCSGQHAEEYTPTDKALYGQNTNMRV